MDPQIENLKNRILDAFRQRAQDLWDGFNEQDRKLIEATAQDAALLQIKELAGQDQSSEWPFIRATFDNMAIAEAARVKTTFIAAITDIVNLFAPAIIKGLTGV